MTEPAVAERYVGRSLPRAEDEPLLRGSAVFLDDMHPDGALHVMFLRSPLAHARIVSVDADLARELAGVEAVLTAADLGLAPLVPPIANADATTIARPLLADGVVRFAGEPVAVVVAADRYTAEDAAELVDLELDPLSPARDVAFDSTLEAGRPDAAFEDAAVVVERTFVTGRNNPAPMEGRGALGEPDRNGGVTLWCSTQSPHKLAQVTAELLRLPRGAVRVRCPSIGGGFGQKAHAHPEEILVAWLALRLGRPVKWAEDRSENLLAAAHARDQVIRLRAAADQDGRLLAIDADVVCDTGAYGVYPHGHTLEALGTPAMIPGPYVLESYRARGRSVVTNKCPEGPYRGVGLPVATFVHERLMDVLAAELGLDPAEIRRRNYVPPERMPYTSVTGQPYDSGDYGAALELALERIGYAGFREEQAAARADGRLIGLGISSYVEYAGPNSKVFHSRGMVGIAGFDGAHVALDEHGRARVWTTIPEIGQGVTTTFAQLAADALGVPLEAVDVVPADTAVGGIHGTGAFASRSAVSGAGAIRAAAIEVVRRLKADAAERLEADPADLVVEAGAVHVAGVPGPGIGVGELASAAPERFRVSAEFDPPAVTYPYATHVCRVEVDPGTGAVAVERYVIVEDCGTMLNAVIVEGQTHGAAAQGIGGALLEAVVYDEDGQPLTGSFMDYLLPTAAELPAFEITHVETPAPGSPTGAKGVGEGGTLAPGAALANAVSDALGAELNELPLTPERVLAALAGRR
jgi:carbon-monoxide dehydrogenase large subunit